MENKLPNRKPTRLKNFDYSSNGGYFVTICTHAKKHILSRIIVGEGLRALPQNKLTNYGKIVDETINYIDINYNGVTIDKYVIMPNHIHILISNYEMTAGASPCPTISDVMCAYKSLTTRLCIKTGLKDKHLFQSSFHDHIIRDKEDYQKIWEYIDTNVMKWELDCFYSD